MRIDMLEGRSAQEKAQIADGRSAEVKQSFYARLCELLVQTVGLREQDLAVCLVENEREDWSFGNGQASYLTIPKDRWR
jgi:phenylpyruvate tautomerase PptA (4-oxalocrotonate tautomerase family)